MSAGKAELADALDRFLPTDRDVIMAAAVNPLGFLAIHGCSASDYIAELRRARAVVAELRVPA